MAGSSILCIDTALLSGSVSLWSGQNPLQCRQIIHFSPAPRLISALAPAIKKLLETQCLALPALDYLAVNLGPGSYTGLRISLATAQGLALAHPGLKMIALHQLEITAWQAGIYDRPLVPVLDARLGQCYSSIYSVDRGQEIKTLLAPACRTWPELSSVLPADALLLIHDFPAAEVWARETQAAWISIKPDQTGMSISLAKNLPRWIPASEINQWQPHYLRPCAAQKPRPSPFRRGINNPEPG